VYATGDASAGHALVLLHASEGSITVIMGAT
jgi:hypothetical protein